MTMAKRPKVKRFSIQAYDNKHYQTTEQYTRAVDALFDAATKAIAQEAAKGTYDPDKPFNFTEHPKVQSVMQNVTTQLASRLTTVIESGSKKQWLFACEKNDGFIASIMDTSKLSKARLKKMQDRNLDALQAFQDRKVDGMNLSQRVWKYVGQYKDQMETALDVGLGEGRSAQQLARDVKQNLNEPNRLFRRVRDKRGNLVLSKNARAFHPGQGVYRSSVKNAQRLTRSEINMAYRESDWQRWQSLDFVVGFEVMRSNHEPRFKCDLCDSLVGRYPKTFKFKGWHPQCMCYAIPILADEETFDENELGDLKAALRGTTYKHKAAANTVVDVPDGFKEWVQDHIKAQERWATTPYFIKDNFKNGNLADGLKIALPTIPATPKIDPVQQQLDALQPQIASIRQMCSEWGLNTYPLDVALQARKPKDVVLAINTLKGRIDTAMNELGAYVTEAAQTIKDAQTHKVDSSSVVADLQAVKADKRDWLMSKASIKQRLAYLKAKVLAAISGAHPAVLKKYDTNAEVDETFKKINAEMKPGERWFEHGDLRLRETNDKGVNGQTNMRGLIELKPDRLERVKIALGKIGSGKADTITFEEADAMATYWHEITHNRSVPGNTWMTKTETRYMELANEFVARHSLPEFYAKLGVKDMPHPEFKTNRNSTGYNPMVTNFDYVIKRLGLEHDKVLATVRKHLFTAKYNDQEAGLKQGLLDGGLSYFTKDGKKPKAIKKSDLNALVKLIRTQEYGAYDWGTKTTTTKEAIIEKWLIDHGFLEK